MYLIIWYDKLASWESEDESLAKLKIYNITSGNLELSRYWIFGAGESLLACYQPIIYDIYLYYTCQTDTYLNNSQIFLKGVISIFDMLYVWKNESTMYAAQYEDVY